VEKFGGVQDIVVREDVPRPRLKPGSKQLLVRVMACSLSPSDYRTLSGDCRFAKNPVRFPYIPGGDICGEVLEKGDGLSDTEVQVGDNVISTWTMFGQGGLAEFALVDSALSIRKPDSLSALEAAAFANTCPYAYLAVKGAQLKEGDRVLILGGSGGMGTLLIQLAKNFGASFVACTTTDTALGMSLGADRVINYRQTNWWEEKEFIENPFDVVFDAAEGLTAWHNIKSSKVLKPASKGGRFIAIVLNEWHIEIRSFGQLVSFLFRPLWRSFASKFNKKQPRYHVHLDSPDKTSMEESLALVLEGKLKIVVDKRSPHPFTTEGVREAFQLHMDRSGHGKIVVSLQ